MGTRGSALARWQAEWVAGRLESMAQVAIELVLIATAGDEQQHGEIAAIGGEGVFTRRIQQALLQGQIDLAVHSLKDLPTDPVEGLALAAVPTRESVADVLISRSGWSLDELPHEATVGTGSLRRRAALLHVRPDLQMVDLRGNVDTRLRKLDDGQADAIVLAEAGLRRLGLLDARARHTLPASLMLPAIGQGALGIETRSDDVQTRALVACVDDAASHAAVTAERALLAHLRGGCMAPVGAWGRAVAGDQLLLEAAVFGHDGGERIAGTVKGPLSEAVELGQRLGQDLLNRGAGRLIAASRGANDG